MTDINTPPIWDQKKKRLKDECSILSDNERDNEEQLISNLQEKLEMSREEIKRILEKL